MKKLLVVLARFVGFAPKGANTTPNLNIAPQAACRPMTIEAEIVASGPNYAFSQALGERIFVPGNVRLDGGTWFDVRPGRRVRLVVVRDRYGRGLRALAATFIDGSDE